MTEARPHITIYTRPGWPYCVLLEVDERWLVNPRVRKIRDLVSGQGACIDSS